MNLLYNSMRVHARVCHLFSCETWNSSMMKQNSPQVGTESVEASGVGHLKPRLSRLTMVGMSFAILKLVTFLFLLSQFVLTGAHSTWIALAGSLGIVMPSGGSVAFLYGFIFCVLCNLCLGASLGEMASIWPTAGGQVCFFLLLCYICLLSNFENTKDADYISITSPTHFVLLDGVIA